MGEGDTEVQAPAEEVAKEEVTAEEATAEEATAEPLQQKSSRLLDAISKARELGADGVDALNSALANLRGIATERINQIGNRIDDLQQKMRNITKASTIPSATMGDLNGKQVNYNGEQATVRVSEGGAVSLETPTQIVDLENVTPTTLAADAKVEVIAPAVEFNPKTDRYVDNDNVVINNVEYGINTNAEGNVVGLALKDGSNQVITNEELMKRAEVIRNTEGNVAPATQTMVSPAVQSDIDALSQEIAALEAERSTIEQETAEPAPAEAPVETDAERRFRGAVLSQTGISLEDLGKLIAILTKANKNVKIIADKAKMVAFLIEKGLSPEQANQVKGVRIGDTVYINPELATVDTPIHEFAHIWGELCKKQRPELWKRGLTLIKMSKYYKELVQRIKDNPELSNLYKTDAQIREEALIQAIGERGATIFDDNKLQLMWNNWVASFDNFIKKVLGLPMNTDITKMKLSEFLDMAATEVLTGKGTGVGGEMAIEKTKAANDFEVQVNAWQAQQSPTQLTKIINDGIKAKLTKAQIINILVKSGGMTVEDATNAYNDVKAGNAINVAPAPAPAAAPSPTTTTAPSPTTTTTTATPSPAAAPSPAPTPTGPRFATRIADAIESMSNGVFDNSVKQALIDNIKAARTQIRQALTREKAMRKELVDMLKTLKQNGNLSQSQALSLLRAFATTDIYSDVAVDKFVNYSMNMMQKSQSRFEASNRKSIISKIADLVNKSKRKMVTSSGKPRARALDAVGNSFFVHVNRIVRAAINDDINEMANISAELGSKQTEIYEALVKEANGEPITAQEADLLDLQYAFDAFGDMMNLSNEELANLYEDLKSARGLSIENMKAFRHARAAEQKLVSERVDQEVKTLNKALYNPDGSLKSQNQRMRDKKAIRAELEKGNIFKATKLYVTSLNNKSLTNLSRWLRDSISNLETITTILGKGTSDFFTKQIYDKLFVAEEVQRRGYQSQMEKMNELATKNGFKDFKDLASALSSGKTYTIDTGTESYILDKDEMLRIYALSLNEIQRNKLMNMGIADAQINEIKNILGDDLVNFANDVVDYLSNEYYNETNSAYVDEYNTRLPRIENYFPTRTVRSNTTANLIQGNFSQVFRADNASALSNRIDKTGEIILDEGFINTLEGHFQQIERFKTFAPVVRELNYVFSSSAFDAYIEETGTKKLMNLLIRNTVIPDGGNPFPTTKSSIFDKYAGFALAFKAMQIPKQAVAAVAAYEDYRLLKNRSTPILDAVGFAYDLGVAFMTLPKQIKKAREISASFNERYEEGLKGNIASTTSGRGGLRSIKQRSGILGKLYRGTKSAASLPTFLGDTLSVMGYMAVYNRNIANGMSPEKAAMEFNKYNKTLQSRNASDRNALQNEQNSLIKTFTMFGSSAFLQMNKVIQSADKIAAKTFKFAKTGDKSNLPSVSEFRAFMLNLGVANALFAWASYAFKITLGDEEDEDEAFSEMMMALFGLNLLTQLPILGDALELIWTSIKGEGISPKGASLNPYTTVAIKTIKGIKDEDIFEATKPIIELAIGSSIDPAIGLYGLATSTSQQEADESFYKVIGLSKSYQPTIDYGETADQYKARVKKQRAKLKEEDPDLYLKIYGEDPVEEETEKEPKEKEKDRKANLN